MDAPRAIVRQIDGQLVLDDPDAYAVMRAVSKHNCKGTLEANAERVAHFVRRVADLGKSTQEVVIVVINVDTPYGAVSDVLMPGQNWQEIRDRGEIPFARGLAGRAGIQEYLDAVDSDAGIKLREWNDNLCIVVIDHGVAEVFKA